MLTAARGSLINAYIYAGRGQRVKGGGAHRLARFLAMDGEFFGELLTEKCGIFYIDDIGIVDATTPGGGETQDYLLTGLAVGIPCGIIIIVLVIVIGVMICFTLSSPR